MFLSSICFVALSILAFGEAYNQDANYNNMDYWGHQEPENNNPPMRSMHNPYMGQPMYDSMESWPVYPDDGGPGRDWYIPPDALPQDHFVDKWNDYPPENEPGQQVHPENPVEGQAWENYGADWYPPIYQGQELPPPMPGQNWYDYNDYYYGPCVEPVWYTGCSDEAIPFCDLAVCTASCRQYIGHGKGACINNQCYCETDRPHDVEWGYDDQDGWANKYPNCGKPRQSPINLQQNLLRDLSRKVTLINYRASVSLIVENTGYGVRLYIQSSILPAIQLSGVSIGENNDVSGRYVLASIDLHWDTSEHAVENRRLDMEMQLNHYKLDYGTYEEAVQVPGATLSLGVLFEEDQNTSDLNETIESVLDKIQNPGGAGEELPAAPYLEFLDDNLGVMFYSYTGSETQPPCNLKNWFVARSLFKVKPDQIKKLQTLVGKDGKPILRNVRQNQPYVTS